MRAGQCRVALDGVSLEVERGQIMGIFGPSGSGKTTLLRIASGLRPAHSGTVTYHGKRLDQMSAAERTRFRRREIACVWQAEAWEAHLSVFNHVAVRLLVDRCGKREAKRRVQEALLACEADQCLHTRLEELSDGERQRVAIARAIVTEPSLLLADSPASSLSWFEQDQIMALLASLAKEARVAVLVTDSNAKALVQANPLRYLRDGKLIDPEPMSDRERSTTSPQAGYAEPPPMLDLERVRKDYESPAGRVHAVNDVSMHVDGREFAVILAQRLRKDDLAAARGRTAASRRRQRPLRRSRPREARQAGIAGASSDPTGHRLSTLQPGRWAHG